MHTHSASIRACTVRARVSVCARVCMCDVCALVCVRVRACVRMLMCVSLRVCSCVFDGACVRVSVCVFIHACARERVFLCLPVSLWLCTRNVRRARRTAVVPAIVLFPLNVTVPPSMYTAPPLTCSNHPSAAGRNAPRAAVHEPEGSRRCARVGDRHVVEHELALSHAHRPSDAPLHARGRRCDQCAA